MNTSYDLNAYRSHDLSIQMRTSSGDTISMDFSNARQLQLSARSDENGSRADFSFTSMQQYQFSVDSNGIDAQDKKEIAAFMEIAKPYIERFMEEVSGDQQSTPLNKFAENITNAMEPLKALSTPAQNSAKNDLVSLFDESTKMFDQTQKLLDESQKLLDKIFKGFDADFASLLYA